MNRKWLISTVVLFVVSMALGFLIHGFMLHDAYSKLPNLIRSEAAAQQLFGLMLLANLIFSGAFAWIYIRGKENRPWMGQGFRYGLAVAALVPVPTYLINYVVMPWPSDVIAQQMVFDAIAVVILGLVVAWLNR
jgi:hypothetical protein